MSEPKPLDYHDRRKWQDAALARGELPECGREACHRLLRPGLVWVNKHTPLLYCGQCARRINEYNPGFCSPEVP